MEKDSDMILVCRQCGKEFVFTAAEKAYYEDKGYMPPHHCRECRSSRRNQAVLLCSKCGGKLGKDSAVYCTACLSSAKYEVELEARKLRGSLEEANTKVSALESEKAKLADVLKARETAVQSEKAEIVDEANAKLAAAESEKARLIHEAESRLRAVESEKARLSELLQQKEQIVAKLEDQFHSVTVELEKEVRYRVSLDSLEPALKGLKERLEALEYNQTVLNQAVLQTMERIGKPQEKSSLIDVVVRILRPHRKPRAHTITSQAQVKP